MTSDTVPFLPENAPFTAEQRAYLNGFLAGLFARQPAAAMSPSVPSAPLRPLTVLFGSQTGNAELLAKKVGKEAGQHGFAPTIVEMAQYNTDGLKDEKHLLLITSTYGDGEPPDNAKAFHDFLHSSAALRLEGVQFSVLALGDTNYEKFCQCGKDFDRRLEELGAKRVFARVDCDVDYEENFQKWVTGAVAALSSPSVTLSEAKGLTMVADRTPKNAEVLLPRPRDQDDKPVASGHTRQNPFPARLLTNRRLNATGSEKETRHFEIELAGSGLSYEVGDALGVWPTNSPERVERFMSAIDCNGDADAVRAALTTEYELARVGLPKEKMHGPEFLTGLKKLQPRLYSIASSPKAQVGQVHLCVAIVRGEFPGVCSTFLADRAETVPVFVQPNRNFRLPASGDTPIIMVGPGTGVAPFRAFLHERRVTGAKGKSWLFFGDQRVATDFLYREELETMVADGSLSRLHTAFSRDQAEKLYVQQRLLENAGEIFAWLEDGAHVYVCGDAKRMAKDVDAALREIVRREGRDADEYVAQLQTAKRYQRDVY